MASSAERKTVLVVEDHEDSREMLCEILENSGLSVIAAGNGIEAIERMQSQVPNVVLTDLSMPRMDGIELARYIKSHDRYGHIPVALISANLPAASPHFPEISAFLLKPCSVDHLLTTVAQLLR
ncbi:response regulator [Herbaspirillum robiniae]|uniref:Response regulator n=1 Tax=Herbaspirillum robiniae TaxID=2014887 RepID=A0A246WMK4_9BURK|nr:response regulator [Herbaspirillum robiniae]NUU02348.1 response regulator [Herbaspirillum robiniae]OWY27595.1 response regulator [Herbaspirillum robiniae]